MQPWPLVRALTLVLALALACPSPWPWSLALALRPDPELGARLIQSFLERHVLSCHRLILSGELPQGRDVTGSVKN